MLSNFDVFIFIKLIAQKVIWNTGRYSLIILMIFSVIFIYLIWLKSIWPPEEIQQYFPQQITRNLLHNTYIFDGQSLNGNSLSGFPLSLLAEIPLPSPPINYFPLIVHTTNFLLIFVLLNSVFKKFNIGRLNAMIGTFYICFSFITINHASYFSKSAGLIWSLTSFLLLTANYFTRWQLIVSFAASSFFTVSMWSNLAVVLASYFCTMLLTIGYFQLNESLDTFIKRIKSRRENVFTFFCVNLIFLTFFLLFYYSNSSEISKLKQLVIENNSRTLWPGSGLFSFIGSGLTLEHDGWLGDPYFTYAPPVNLVMVLRLLLVLFPIIYFTGFFMTRWIKSRQIISFDYIQIMKGCSFLIFSAFLLFILTAFNPFNYSVFERSPLDFLSLAFREPNMKFGFYFILFFTLVIFILLETLDKYSSRLGNSKIFTAVIKLFFTTRYALRLNFSQNTIRNIFVRSCFALSAFIFVISSLYSLINSPKGSFPSPQSAEWRVILSETENSGMQLRNAGLYGISGLICIRPGNEIITRSWIPNFVKLTAGTYNRESTKYPILEVINDCKPSKLNLSINSYNECSKQNFKYLKFYPSYCFRSYNQ